MGGVCLASVSRGRRRKPPFLAQNHPLFCIFRISDIWWPNVTTIKSARVEFPPIVPFRSFSQNRYVTNLNDQEA